MTRPVDHKPNRPGVQDKWGRTDHNLQKAGTQNAEGKTLPKPRPAQAPRDGFEAGRGPRGVDLGGVTPSIPTDEATQLSMLSSLAAQAGYSSLEELDLAHQFAGLKQWQMNQEGEGGRKSVAKNPALQNVGMVSLLRDSETRSRLISDLSDQLKKGTARDIAAERKALIPDWAPEVQQKLAEKGVPFEVELLADIPHERLMDSSGDQPLFERGSMPKSLHPVTHGQASSGEAAMFWTPSDSTGKYATAADIMTDLWPHVFAYDHRPAKAPVPEGYEAGLSFGSPVFKDGGYVRSPIMSEAIYLDRMRGIGDIE